MACGAGLRRGLLHLVEVRCPVRGMAVGAFHQTFRNPVMRGQCEGGPDIAMALVAEFRLTLPEQTACQPSILFGQRRHGEELRLRALHGFALRTIRRRYQMYRMAILASHSIQCVAGMIELRLLLAGLMTRHAASRVRLRIAFEREDQFVCRRRFGVVAVSGFLRIRMRLAGAMAHLTTDYGILVFGEGRVRRLAEFNEFGFVTTTAAIVANVIGSRLRRWDCFRRYGYGFR